MNNFICCADLHIRANRPVHRKDDYLKSVVDKFTQIVNIANVHKADIICAGDFFDHITVGHKVVNTIIPILNSFNGKIYLVIGQHDMAFHRKDLTSSPLQTLLFRDDVILLNSKKPIKIGKNYLYGCSWEEEPIIPKDKKNSILIIHRSITPEEPPFFLKEAISAEDALDKYEGYFLIVSGDYHESFMAEKCGNVLVNCGTMMRSSIDKIKTEPKVWFVNSKNNEIEGIKLDIKDPEEVFILEKIENKDNSKFTEDLVKLVEVLKNKTSRPDFKQVVTMIMKKTKTNKLVKKKIKEIIKEAENG